MAPSGRDRDPAWAAGLFRSQKWRFTDCGRTSLGATSSSRINFSRLGYAMNDHETRELFLTLLRADTEAAVIKALDQAGMWTRRNVWRLYGDRDGNYATIGNQPVSYTHLRAHETGR